MARDLLTRIKEKGFRYTHILSPNRSLIAPIKSPDLFFRPLNASERGTAVGRFYEFVSVALYGGIPNDVKFSYKMDGGSFSTKPDVYNPEEKWYAECKSSAPGRSSNVMDRQTLGNIYLQMVKPDHKIDYHFYRHNVRWLKTRYGNGNGVTEDGLFSDLADNTLFSFTLPFDVVLHLVNPDKDTGNAARYYHCPPPDENGKHKYDNCTCFNSGFMHRAFFDMEGELESLGLDPDNYRIRRFRSPDLFFDGMSVKHFPIIRVDRKNYRQWVRDFLQDEELIDSLTEYLSRKPVDPGIKEVLEEEYLEGGEYPDIWDDIPQDSQN